MPERTQEGVPLARVCLSQLPISGGAATGHGSPGGVAQTADDNGCGIKSPRSAQQNSQVGNAAEPEEDLPEAFKEPATVDVGQRRSQW